MAAKHYWGKAKWRNDDTAGDDYHLLPYHGLDVAACGYFMVVNNHFYAADIFAQLGFKQKEQAANWFAYYLSVHDIGKYTGGFQQLYQHNHDDLVKPIAKTYIERHDSLGYWLWKDKRFNWPNAFPPCSNLTERQQKRINHVWLRLVTGHHGLPPKNNVTGFTLAVDDDDIAAAMEYTHQLDQLFTFQHYPNTFHQADFLKHLEYMSWEIAGLVVLADWLGSNSHYFPYVANLMSINDYWQAFALPRAEKSLTELPKLATVAPFNDLTTLFPFIQKPTPLQQKAIDVDLSSDGGQLFILEDVTGAGKTEAAMVLAHRLMSAGKGKGIYLALPTMATANAMYSRLAKAYSRLYQAGSSPSLVLAHGASQMSTSFSQSIWHDQPNEQTHDHSQDETTGADCHHWFADSRKKALLADIGVGTLDQALMGVMPYRHQSLRLLGLRNKILIIDEVHAYDAYTQALLEALLRFHASRAGSVIILTATLPYAARQHLVDAFNQGLGQKQNLLQTQANYPWFTHANTQGVTEVELTTREEVRRDLEVQWINQPAQGIDLIERAVKAGQSICWIKNSVDDAMAIYQMLLSVDWLEQNDLLLFHSRFAFCDRIAIEQTTLDWFGKDSNAEQRNGKVLIATQVVEQSLDIDLDMMITDLAPIDLLIQRAGRLQRHHRDKKGNPKNDQHLEPTCDERPLPSLYIMAPEWQANATQDWLNQQLRRTSYVYPDHGCLWRTQKVLVDLKRIRMPEDARYLIETVYDEQIPLPAALQASSDQNECSAMRQSAQHCTLEFDQGYNHTASKLGWRNDITISTRFAEPTIDLYLAYYSEQLSTVDPYSTDSDFPWEKSHLSVRESWWQKHQSKLPQLPNAQLECFRRQIYRPNAVVVVLPTGIDPLFYSPQMGLL